MDILKESEVIQSWICNIGAGQRLSVVILQNGNTRMELQYQVRWDKIIILLEHCRLEEVEKKILT